MNPAKLQKMKRILGRCPLECLKDANKRLKTNNPKAIATVYRYALKDRRVWLHFDKNKEVLFVKMNSDHLSFEQKVTEVWQCNDALLRAIAQQEVGNAQKAAN